MEILDSIEVLTAPDPSWSVIWLHGLGADGHDFAPAVPALGLAPKPAVRFLFPHAPVRPVTINMGMKMRAWYDILTLGNSSLREEENGVRHSALLIEALVSRERERGIPASQILLCGFSQGAAMALHVGLHYPEALGGIVALSGYLALAQKSVAEIQAAHANNRQVPIFMAHGIYDPVVPFEAGRKSSQEIEHLGFKVAFHQYPCDHTVSAQEFTDLGKWFQQRLTKKGAD